jgi:hypothetical protein
VPSQLLISNGSFGGGAVVACLTFVVFNNLEREFCKHLSRGVKILGGGVLLRLQLSVSKNTPLL